MRVLVCGGRDFNFPLLVNFVLDTLRDAGHHQWDAIIEGGAPGADTCARKYAESVFIEVETYIADWKQHGKRAGYIRNQQMLKEGNPDLVVAFPGGAGTKMMVKLAKSAKVKVIDFNNWD